MMVDHYRYINCCRWLWIPSCRSMNCRLLTKKSRSKNVDVFWIFLRFEMLCCLTTFLWTTYGNHVCGRMHSGNVGANWPDCPTLQGFVHSVRDPKTHFLFSKMRIPQNSFILEKVNVELIRNKKPLVFLQVCKCSIFWGGLAIPYVAPVQEYLAIHTLLQTKFYVYENSSSISSKLP